MPWRRKWQSTLVFLPGKSHGQRSLVGDTQGVERVGHNLVTKPTNQPTNQCGTLVPCPGLEPMYPALEGRLLTKAMATHSSTLAWKIPWMEELGRLQSMGSLRVGHDWATSLSLSCIGGGNGNPLQCSCLENPWDGGGLVDCRLWGHTESDTTEAT